MKYIMQKILDEQKLHTLQFYLIENSSEGFSQVTDLHVHFVPET